MSSASESASLAAASEDQLVALAVQLKRSQRELEAAQQAKDAERLHRLEALQVTPCRATWSTCRLCEGGFAKCVLRSCQ